MKICVAQTRPVKGDIQSNIDRHKEIIALAISNGADTIIFPELSITGYEPRLAKELAIDLDDIRFDDFQKIADTDQITIGAEKAFESLAEIARKYSMTVLMSNCIGQCDDFESVGKTSVWNNQGLSIGQLNDTDEGIIILDTNTQAVIEKYLI